MDPTLHALYTQQLMLAASLDPNMLMYQQACAFPEQNVLIFHSPLAVTNDTALKQLANSTLLATPTSTSTVSDGNTAAAVAPQQDMTEVLFKYCVTRGLGEPKYELCTFPLNNTGASSVEQQTQVGFVLLQTAAKKRQLSVAKTTPLPVQDTHSCAGAHSRSSSARSCVRLRRRSAPICGRLRHCAHRGAFEGANRSSKGVLHPLVLSNKHLPTDASHISAVDRHSTVHAADHIGGGQSGAGATASATTLLAHFFLRIAPHDAQNTLLFLIHFFQLIFPHQRARTSRRQGSYTLQQTAILHLCACVNDSSGT